MYRSVGRPLTQDEAGGGEGAAREPRTARPAQTHAPGTRTGVTPRPEGAWTTIRPPEGHGRCEGWDPPSVIDTYTTYLYVSIYFSTQIYLYLIICTFVHFTCFASQQGSFKNTQYTQIQGSKAE